MEGTNPITELMNRRVKEIAGGRDPTAAQLIRLVKRLIALQCVAIALLALILVGELYETI